MKLLVYPVPAQVNGDGLEAELATSGVAGCRVAVAGDQLEVTAPDTANDATVESVVAAHMGQPTGVQQAAATREADAVQAEGSLASTAGIRAKCKAVLAGTDSFTNPQRDRAIAALALRALRDRADT